MPNTYENTFSNIYERGFMTPTYLSSLIMNAVLPAKFSVKKHDDLGYARQTFTHARTSNTSTPYLVNGIETFEIPPPRRQPNLSNQFLW